MEVELETRGTITLSVTRADGYVDVVEIQRPSVGWGGGTAVVSPRATYVCVVWDSGQHDAGYELFAVNPSLHRVGGLERVYGTGAIVAFSPDERHLAMLSGIDPSLDGWETDQETEVEWAQLRVAELPACAPMVCSVVVTIPPVATQGSASYYPEVLRFVTEDRLELAGPSQALVTVELPLPPSIEVDPPVRIALAMSIEVDPPVRR